MTCTTLLIGKKASYNGSTIIARTEDSGPGNFCPKRFCVVEPKEQPRHYVSVLGHCVITLPDNPMRYTAVPNAILERGIWGEAGFNEAGVSMSATETLTTNERVIGADPFVALIPAVGTPEDDDYEPEVPGGINEEDFLTIVLPYIHTAREGVKRLGSLLEEFGTWEKNGTAFADGDEIWWMETVGGHHWIARRVPDDCYATIPNQLGIDKFDLSDALGAQKDFMCSADLPTWMNKYHLDLTMLARTGTEQPSGVFNPREAFGSHTQRDHVYNTPRAWAMHRLLQPSKDWDSPAAKFGPESDNIPWCAKPERLLTIEDVKDVLSCHFEGTPFDPYGNLGTEEERHRYRTIGINRQNQLAVLETRPDAPELCRYVQWIAFSSMPFNTLVPFFAQVSDTPAYVRDTTARPTTENFYWANRIIAAMADAHYNACINDIERYRQSVMAFGHQLIAETDKAVEELGEYPETEEVERILEGANARMAKELKRQTNALLDTVLFTCSNKMHNAFVLADQ